MDKQSQENKSTEKRSGLFRVLGLNLKREEDERPQDEVKPRGTFVGVPQMPEGE